MYVEPSKVKRCYARNAGDDFEASNAFGVGLVGHVQQTVRTDRQVVRAIELARSLRPVTTDRVGMGQDASSGLSSPRSKAIVVLLRCSGDRGGLLKRE